MKYIKAIVFAALTVSPIISCTQQQQESQSIEHSELCTIREQVYENHWKTCGEIIVHSDKSYTYHYHDLWDHKPNTSTFSGTLPDLTFSILETSVSESGMFKSDNHIPTYSFGIDNTKTKHPKGVHDVLELIHNAHTSHDVNIDKNTFQQKNPPDQK